MDVMPKAEEILKEAMAKDPPDDKIPVVVGDIRRAQERIQLRDCSSGITLSQLAGSSLSVAGPGNGSPLDCGIRRPWPAESLPRQQRRLHLAIHARSPDVTLLPLALIAHDLDFDLKLPTAKPSVAKVDLLVSEVRAEASSALDSAIILLRPHRPEEPGAQPASGLDFDLSGLDVPAKSTASSSSLADVKGGLDGQYNDE